MTVGAPKAGHNANSRRRHCRLAEVSSQHLLVRNGRRYLFCHSRSFLRARVRACEGEFILTAATGLRALLNASECHPMSAFVSTRAESRGRRLQQISKRLLVEVPDGKKRSGYSAHIKERTAYSWAQGMGHNQMIRNWRASCAPLAPLGGQEKSPLREAREVVQEV
jgi:hypothetical protein